MPVRWREPFGMVMIEALACGTPVIAFPEGAAREIVIDGENGFHAADEQAMAEATSRLGAIDPRRCREGAISRYDVGIVAAGYERVYGQAIQAEQGRTPGPARAGQRTSRRHEPAEWAPRRAGRPATPSLPAER